MLVLAWEGGTCEQMDNCPPLKLRQIRESRHNGPLSQTKNTFPQWLGTSNVGLELSWVLMVLLNLVKNGSIPVEE